MPSRRFFSAFPDAWPGHGLLLLRLTLGLPLVYWGAVALTAPRAALIPDLAAAAAGILFISGLFTPFAGTIIVLAEVWMAFTHAFTNQPETGTRWFFAAAAASLAMLGPGAWSVDALRFGRKVFEIGEPRHPRS